VTEEFLVLGQKADMSASNLSLVVRPSSLVHRLTSVILCVFESSWLKQNAVLISVNPRQNFSPRDVNFNFQFPHKIGTLERPHDSFYCRPVR